MNVMYRTVLITATLVNDISQMIRKTPFNGNENSLRNSLRLDRIHSRRIIRCIYILHNT